MVKTKDGQFVLSNLEMQTCIDALQIGVLARLKDISSGTLSEDERYASLATVELYQDVLRKYRNE